MRRRCFPVRLRYTVARAALCVGLTVAGALPAAAQTMEPAPSGEFRAPTPSSRHRQDSRLDNLQHAPGYATAKPGELGEVVLVGAGETPAILIPGVGNGWRVFDALIDAHDQQFRFHAVTLPGYGGSSAPPMPPEGTPYAERTWSRAAEEAIVKLIRERNLARPVLITYYSESAHIALRVALRHPELVGGVLVMTASARSEMPPGTTRADYMEAMGSRWFKTVTQVMWPSGMFPPAMYSNQPDVAERAWWEALQPTIPTAVRWLLETWVDDLVPDLPKLQVPTVVLSPGFNEEILGSQAGPFLAGRFNKGWEAAREAGATFEFRIVDDARFMIWVDQPGAVATALEELTTARAAAAESCPATAAAQEAQASAAAR